MHPVSFLIEKVIEIHNRSEFEIYGYSINLMEDNVTKKFYKSFDVFRNISKLSDEMANKIIRRQNRYSYRFNGLYSWEQDGILSSRPLQFR